MFYAKMNEFGEMYGKKEINQSSLTSDCWLIQFEGLIACKGCEYYGTDDCGGGNTLKKLNNEGCK